jgi:hypothetical protein
MLNPAWPKRIDCGHGSVTPEMFVKRAFPKAKSDHIFGQPRKQLKMFIASP